VEWVESADITIVTVGDTVSFDKAFLEARVPPSLFPPLPPPPSKKFIAMVD
jgi:hypothetical protein